jgi:hypothetical protein
VDIGQLQYENIDINAGQVGRHWRESWRNKKKRLIPYLAVFRIRYILEWIRMRGSVPLTEGSGFRSCSFC